LFIGDSITQGGLYIKQLEQYFAEHLPDHGLVLRNAGLSSETASGLSEPDHPFPRPCIHSRLEQVLAQHAPDWVVFCYGMNDGIYYPFSEERFQRYQEGIHRIVDRVRGIGAKVAVMTPPPFDAKSMDANRLLPSGEDEYSYKTPYANYNEDVLSTYAQWIRTELRPYVDCVIDIHSTMQAHLLKARVKDPAYISGDGIHPNAAGHGIMARTILRELFFMELMRDELTTVVSDWHCYERIDDVYRGREVILVRPHHPAPGRPWVWRTEFFGAFAQADLALLAQGWHVAYYRLSHMYGSPAAVEWMKSFHTHIVTQHALSVQASLFGFSRGGLYAINYATTYPADVAAIYLDAPVLDLRSWPGGLWQGKGYPQGWEEVQAVYAMNVEEVRLAAPNLIDRVETLVRAGIPILLVAGDADVVVPYEENGAKLVTRIEQLGGKISVILKPGVDHHPHSLEDVTPIVTFFQQV
jgi:lysophospholipase L1-like esterase/pimeloyl-ACP methyl ester carboxylesterase